MCLLHRDTALKISLSSKTRIRYCCLCFTHTSSLTPDCFTPFPLWYVLKSGVWFFVFTILMKCVLFFHVYLYHAQTKGSWFGHAALSSGNPEELRHSQWLPKVFRLSEWSTARLAMLLGHPAQRRTDTPQQWTQMLLKSGQGGGRTGLAKVLNWAQTPWLIPP